MMKWRFQFILLVTMMACLVLGGIHLAEKGTARVDGVRNAPSQSFHIARVDNGGLEMTVLGRQYEIENKNSPNAPNNYSSSTNWMSSTGTILGQWISSVTGHVMNWFAP